MALQREVDQIPRWNLEFGTCRRPGDWIALLAKRAKGPIEGSSLAKPSTWLEFVICYLEFTEGRRTGLLFSQGKKSGLGGGFTKKPSA